MTASLPIDENFPEPGRLFAERYHIARLIGTGGHSRVYSARQQGFDRDVAVKVLTLDGQTRATREIMEKRFYREARLLSRLRGPNTLRVYDYGRTESGQLFMVAELVEGTDLKELLRTHGPLQGRRAQRIFTQVLRGLLEVHSEGFLHRDIKPSNIMVFDHLGERDRVKLLDFGIAKGVGGDADETAHTMAGFVIGTPGYMSPEQALGHPMQAASDIFSAGLVAFEMLTGRSPYLGLSLEQMQRRVMAGPLRLPGTVDVEADLAAVIHRSLLVETDQRYASAADALRDLGVSADTIEVPVASSARTVSNVLTFPLNFDVTGSTAIDTLADPDTGQTVTITLPGAPLLDDHVEASPDDLLDEQPTLSSPRRSRRPFLVVFVIAVVAVGVAIWLASRGDVPPDSVPLPMPAAEIAPAISAASDVLVRSARNAELDAVISAKESMIEAAPDVPSESEMKFDESDAESPPAAPIRRAVPKLEVEPGKPVRPRDKPRREPEGLRPPVRPGARPDPMPPMLTPKTDFDVRAIDEL